MAGNTYPADRLGTPASTTWPRFGEVWFDETTTYPVARGTERPLRGWTCSGCGHGYSPFVRECAHCPEAKAPAERPAGANCLPGCCDGDGS